MKSFKSFFSDTRKFSFYALMFLSTLTLVSYQNCGKVKFSAPRDSEIGSLSCGSITLNPSNGIYPVTNVNFSFLIPENGSATNPQWTFRKDTTIIHTSNTSTVDYSFDGASEGAGSYSATVTFLKGDGNSCELTQAFQVLSNDLCAAPTGISGPAIGYVGEQTSAFSINDEDCFNGTITWDMNGDNTPEYNTQADGTVTHTYNSTGVYTIIARVTDQDSGDVITLQTTIEIRNKSCINPFTGQSISHGQSLQFAKPNPTCGGNPCLTQNRTCNNGVFGGDTTFTQNPATCAASAACPTCNNGAINPPDCNQCSGGLVYLPFDNRCHNPCGNGASNPPDCTQCPAGRILIGGFCETPTYSWVTTTWSACSATACGTAGNQTRTVTCRRNDGTTVADSFCTGTKPQSTQTCAARACNDCNINGTVLNHGMARTFYSTSSATCPQTCQSEIRTCVDGVPTGNNAFIHATCNGQTCQYSWAYGNWSTCSATACGTNGTQTRPVYCLRSDGQTAPDANCTGTRPQSSQSCSARACNNCTLDGVTVIHGQPRNFYSSNAVSCPQTCQAQSRTCTDGVLGGNTSFNRANCTAGTCTYTWEIVGTWSSCSATACGTNGTQTRSVICRRSDGTIVADSNCTATRPSTSQACSAPACVPGYWCPYSVEDTGCSDTPRPTQNSPCPNVGDIGVFRKGGSGTISCGSSNAPIGTVNLQCSATACPLPPLGGGNTCISCNGVGWVQDESCTAFDPRSGSRCNVCIDHMPIWCAGISENSCREQCDALNNDRCSAWPIVGGCAQHCDGSGIVYTDCR